MQNRTVFLLLAHILLFGAIQSSTSYAQHHPERWYQSRWCADVGTMEVVMPSGARCDCLNATHAVEFDFAKKWAEAVGQALNYAAQSGKQPGVVLILERPGDRRFVDEVKTVREKWGLPITVWTVDWDGVEIPE